MEENVKFSDDKVEEIMGNLLRIGVIISAIIVLAGGIFYLFKYGLLIPEYSVFKGEPERFKSLYSIVKEVFLLRSRGIIQFGLLLLIATPIARVIFALIAFSIQKDNIYVVITTIVLITLLLSFFNII